MPRLFVLESPWEQDVRSALSVGPFLAGLKEALEVDVVSQRFNGREDLVFYLKEFSKRSSEFTYCYIACHGTPGRLEPLLETRINIGTISDACQGSRGRGFIMGACSFGNHRTATKFLTRTGATFVAGYSGDVPWMESMLVDLMFLTYLLRGRRKRKHGAVSKSFVVDRYDEYAPERTKNPLKVAKWVYEDLPLARMLRFVVHRRRPGAGPAVINSYPPARPGREVKS
jgi:hypothetical protein